MGASPAQTPSDQLEEVYRAHMERLLDRVTAWFPTLQGLEEDLYQAAWATLLAKDRSIEDLEMYLEAAVFNAGLKELRRRRRRSSVPLSVTRFREGADGHGVWKQGIDAVADRTEPLPEEHAEDRDDARLVGELLEELTPLQRKIIKLHWGLGIPRREVAAVLSISERTAKRKMLAAAAIIARNAELVRAEKWCEKKQPLVVAYTLGLTGPRRSAKARDHLQWCSGCRVVALEVRDRLQGLAAVLPLPALATHPSAQGLLARAAELGDVVRQGATDLAAGAREHALSLFARTPAADTAASQVAVGGGLRGGGSALAAVTACLVAGGGATYCAVEGVPDSFRGLAPIERSKEDARVDRPQEPKQQAPVADQAPPASVPQSEPVGNRTSPAESKSPASTAATTEAQPSPAPRGSVEFGPAPESAKPSTPAPAPASGGGEFTP